MNGSDRAKFKPSLFLTAVLGSLVLVSCSSSSQQAEPEQQMEAAPQLKAAPMASPAMRPPIVPAMPSAQLEASDAAVAQVPKQRPQLIKNAELSLSVASIDKLVPTVLQIVKQKQGDLFRFEDNKPEDNTTRHTASMEIKVPQQELEPTLDKLAKLGTVQRRTLTAEDVTDQIVDNDARLRNLRKQEATLLKIMERSGSVRDVLSVAQELSNVRQNIEQIDAQLKSLKNRVAYSTINLTMEEAIALAPTGQPVGVQVQDTWNQASDSVGKFTVNLIRLSVALLVWSPYLLLLAGAAYGFNRIRKQKFRSLPPQSQPPKEH
jgi:hypothetical protein